MCTTPTPVCTTCTGPSVHHLRNPVCAVFMFELDAVILNVFPAPVCTTPVCTAPRCAPPHFAPPDVCTTPHCAPSPSVHHPHCTPPPLYTTPSVHHCAFLVRFTWTFEGSTDVHGEKLCSILSSPWPPQCFPFKDIQVS